MPHDWASTANNLVRSLRGPVHELIWVQVIWAHHDEVTPPPGLVLRGHRRPDRRCCPSTTCHGTLSAVFEEDEGLRKGTHWPTHPFHPRLVGGGDPPLPPPTSLLPHTGPCDHGTFSPRAASSEVNSSRESEVGVASLLGSDASIKCHLKGNWRKMLSSKMKTRTMTKSRAIAEQCSLWLICVLMAILVYLEVRASLASSKEHLAPH